MSLNAFSILPKRGTAAQWTASNPVLKIGEVGFESDTRQEKRGDGVTPWNDLSYFGADILAVRASVSATTLPLGNNVADTTQVLALGRSFIGMAIQTSRPARVTLYETAAAMAADAARGASTKPANDAGVILDFVTTNTALHTLSPQPAGSNMETVPSINIPMRVTNLDSATGTVTVTLIAIRTE